LCCRNSRVTRSAVLAGPEPSGHLATSAVSISESAERCPWDRSPYARPWPVAARRWRFRSRSARRRPPRKRHSRPHARERRVAVFEPFLDMNGGKPAEAMGSGFRRQKTARSRTNCEMIHFSPFTGGRPAWRVRTSALPSASAFTKNSPSPRRPLWLIPSRGNAVSPQP